MTRTALRSLTALILLSGVTVAWSASPLEESVRFEIKAQPLDHALRQVAKQSSYRIIFPAGLPGWVASDRPVAGEMQVRQALDLLLAGTGLRYKLVGDRLISIEPAQPALVRTSLSSDGDGVSGKSDNAALEQAATDAASNPAPADNSSQAASQTQTLEDVTVTGTRITGFEAPTPVAALSVQELNAIAAPNIGDAVERMPQFANSVTNNNSNTNVSSGTAGIYNLNLRGLYPIRTLVLIDGQRLVGSTVSGFVNNGSAVDVNVIPDALVERVDVVTGGASAVYGSDALAGVVNFVLNHNFNGIKAEAQGSETTYGDDGTYKLSITAGTPFADGRGHFEISADDTNVDGIRGNPRAWQNNASTIYISNPNYTPTNGQPSLITRPNVSPSIATWGGLIDAQCVGAVCGGGPLVGTMFGPGGAPQTFTYGPINNGFEMAGGDWKLAQINNIPDLAGPFGRQSLFSRMSFNVTDNAEIYGQVQWTYTSGGTIAVPNFQLGSITVPSDNAYLPASIKSQMTAMGVSSLIMGSYNQDLPYLGAKNARLFSRYNLGGDGHFDVFGTTWNWDAFYGFSSTNLNVKSPGNVINNNYALATDAVFNPANGQIVCRSTLSNPNNGCVPYDVFGTGVNSQAAINYVIGQGWENSTLRQHTTSASVTGKPLSTWAGPVSFALGAEYRDEETDGIASALDEANGYFAGNYHPTYGSYHVFEGSLETVVPLVNNQFWTRSLEFNGAFRATDYSTSGYVSTWKLGLIWQPIDDFRIRATRSRDIRAPNLGDLYSGGQSGTGTVFDPSNGQTTTINSPVTGNPNLKPEVANTTGLGIVLTPRFAPGFTASVDYYSIGISQAISTLSAQEYVDRCYQGELYYCAFIQRTNGLISFITLEPANVLSQRANGLDIEAAYRLGLASIFSGGRGNLSFHALMNYVYTLETLDTSGSPASFQGAGVNADGPSAPFAPKYRYTASVAYELDPFLFTLTGRGISSGVYNNSYISCTSGCPAATGNNPTIDNNHIPSVTYFDFNLNYQFNANGQVFFVVENMFNRDPPQIAGSDVSGGFYDGDGNATFYDRLGRIFHLGVRYRIP
jgi:outer membrane receptor protein involved in Fe transport